MILVLQTFLYPLLNIMVAMAVLVLSLILMLYHRIMEQRMKGQYLTCIWL
jgi:hypothetical protein